MTTIVDPAGTPQVINRDQATSVYEVTAAGTTGGTATALTVYSTVNVVIVTSDQNGRGVKLPAAQDGDYIEAHNVSDFTMKIYDPSGTEVGWSGTKRFQARYLSGSWRHLHQ